MLSQTFKMILLTVLLCMAVCPVLSHVEFNSDMPINDEPAGGGSIDQLIVDAANSSREFQFFYDENHRFLKVEYDIVLSFDEYEAMKQANSENSTEEEESGEGASRKKRTVGLKAGPGGAQRWANNIVYFQFMPHFSGKDINTIHAAIADWERYTCLDFRQNNGARNRIKFMNGGGCYSRLGMVGGVQDLGLAQGCRYKGIVIHELGHALGLHHEQTRPDRDNYVRIVRNNIPRQMYYNFEKQTWRTVMQLGIPYDYTSIMHYGKTAFSTNGQLTIQTINPSYQNTIGNREGLSFGDIKTINIMYNCKRHTSSCTKNDDDCPGEGFVGKDCTCVCRGSGIGNPTKACQGGGGSVTPRPTNPPRVTTPRRTPRPTQRPTPRPTRRPNNCKDQNTHCQYWARVGECNVNPRYMHVYCKKSCNKCGRRVVSSCRDSHPACSMWKSYNYCTTRYRHVVRPRCKKSCGLCGGARDEETATTTRAPVVAVVANCADMDNRCASWARTGECNRNPNYMLQSCKRSCGRCGGALANAAAAATNNRANCFDSNTYCSYWRSIGQCTSNYYYMVTNCRRSCGVC